MLMVFRKYQRFLFIIITVVTIASFSFFGTYSAFTRATPYDTTAFTSVDGTSVSRSDLESLALFIGTDSYDKLLFGGAPGLNFLNDGVIQKDFLETGLANILVQSYVEDLKEDLNQRLRKEKGYRHYQNPNAKFLNAQMVWNSIAPKISTNLKTLKEFDEAATPEAFEARSELYLAEREFPSPILKRVLKLQEQQYQWVPSDPNLDQLDLSLFGHHTLEDWFGPRFVRLIAQFIINASVIAEEKGYEVSKDEALADLYRNAQLSFEQNQKNPYFTAVNSKQYIQDQLQRMGMDLSKAATLWRQVMLFRRLFHDFGNSVLVDTLPDQSFLQYSNAFVKGDLYSLPEALKIRDQKNLQLLELYIRSVSPNQSTVDLEFPEKFLTPDQVAQQYPELVQRRYLIEIAEIDVASLYDKISIRELWKWQKDSKNWETLKKNFPELVLANGESFQTLEALDRATRAKIDAFSRNQMVQEHPEWITEALDSAAKQKRMIALRARGGTIPLKGISNKDELSSLFENPSLELEQYSQNQKHYYRIKVLDKSDHDEILTFAEAKRDGTLSALHQEEKPEQNSNDSLSVLKLMPHLEKQKSKIQSNPNNPAFIQSEEKEELVLASLPERRSLSEQWKLVKSNYEISRSKQEQSLILFDDAFNMTIREWTSIHQTKDGNLLFFQLQEKGTKVSPEELALKVEELHKMVSHEAMQILMKTVLERISDHNAISFDYLKKSVENE